LIVVLDMKTLRELIRLLNEEKLTEITIADGNERITVRREPAAAVPVTAHTAAVLSEGSHADDGTFELDAPLVGTFYRKRSPDAPTLVEVGDHVEAGTTLCIIEAMKVMNEIIAERSGVLQAVLAQDGSPVEFGQPLFRFEADGESPASDPSSRRDTEQTSPAPTL